MNGASVNRALPLYSQVSFGPFIFRLADRRLWCDGNPVVLKPKEAELLLLLCERSPETATRDEIIERIWVGFASDSALNQTVYRLRQCLARYDATSYIETVPERGFRLVAESPLSAVKHQPDALQPGFARFQKAVALYQQSTGASVLRAIELMKEICEEEPAYVPALEALASAYCEAGIRLLLPANHAYWYARSLIARIITLNPASAGAYATLSKLLLFFNGNRNAARDAAERAMLLAPKSAAAHGAAAWERLSRRDYSGALTQADIALSAEPASSALTTLFGTILYMSRRYNEAHDAFESARTLDENDTMAAFYDACAYAMEGEYRLTEEVLALIPDGDMPARVAGIRGYVAAKRFDDVAVERTLATLHLSTAPEYASLCIVELALNEFERAAATLERALHAREAGIFLAAVDPIYAPLQQHYPALMDAIEGGQPHRCDRCGTALVVHRVRAIYETELCWECRYGSRPLYLDAGARETSVSP